ncbi:MAG: hypothetical protein K2J12_01910 [Muribaculaceae bacterium]|nr:hypothetical protein [Muribaculaceae bacterium]
MADIKIAGVMRAGIFSPNHIGNDSAIFNLVAEQLRKRGCEVNVYSEEQFISGAVSENTIFNMCREPRSIELLQKLEDRGALVINSGYGIENCIRERMARILLGNNIPYPESIVVSTDEAIRDRLTKSHISRCWIKRGDSHTMHNEDVTYVRHPEEAQEILQEYFLRGIKRAVINRHLEGELIKFYGIAGTSFFYWLSASNSSSSRRAASRQSAPGFDEQKLKALCSAAAEVLDINVYGGDCVVEPDGIMRIIDFDDWPSFAPCRQDAATNIAKFIMSSIKERTKAGNR